MDVIQRLKIPMKLVLGFGTGSMRDLNTFLRPALDNNQISKEEDQAIRDYRRRYSNRRSQGKLTFLRDRTGCVFVCFVCSAFCASVVCVVRSRARWWGTARGCVVFVECV